MPAPAAKLDSRTIEFLLTHIPGDDTELVAVDYFLNRFSVNARSAYADAIFDAGYEPVKLCFKDGKPVEFSKVVNCFYDQIGEWPGFARLSSVSANLIADDLDERMVNGDIDAPCEDSMRRIILESADDEFEFLDMIFCHDF